MAGFRSLSKPAFILLGFIIVASIYSLQSSYSLPSAVDLSNIDVKSHVPKSFEKIAGAMAESTPNPPVVGGGKEKDKIVHVVMFEFTPETPKNQAKLLIDKMLALKHKCLHPTTSQHYIKSLTGGKDNSPEGMQRGIQYIFIVEFSKASDRQYYLEKDPAHLSFVEDLKKSGFLANATVVDFTPGVF